MLLIIIKNCKSEFSNIKMLFFFKVKIIFKWIEIFDLAVYNVYWYFIDKYT